MTQKAQQNSWKDPSKNWGQNEGSQGAGEQGNNRKTGNLSLQKGELPKSSLYCLLLKEDSVPGSGKPTGVDGSEATIKHKRKTYYD